MFVYRYLEFFSRLPHHFLHNNARICIVFFTIIAIRFLVEIWKHWQIQPVIIQRVKCKNEPWKITGLILICHKQNPSSSTVATSETNRGLHTANCKTMYSPRLIKMTDGAQYGPTHHVLCTQHSAATTTSSAAVRALHCVCPLHMYDLLGAITRIKLHVKFGIYTHKFISMAF